MASPPDELSERKRRWSGQCTIGRVAPACAPPDQAYQHPVAPPWPAAGSDEAPPAHKLIALDAGLGAAELGAAEHQQADPAATLDEQRSALTLTTASDAKTSDADSKLSKVRTIRWEMFLLFVFFPGLVLLVCLALGAVLARVEGWTWQTGLEYMVSTTCGLANPMGNANNVSPQTGIGMTMAGVFGLWAIGSTGLLCGWASEAKSVNFVVDSVTRLFSVKDESAASRKVLAIAFSLFLASPLIIMSFVFLSGCIMDLAEKWLFLKGTFYILADVGGLPNPLVQSTPSTKFGYIFDMIISSWCFVFGSTLIGLASSLPMPGSRQQAASSTDESNSAAKDYRDSLSSNGDRE